MPTSESMKLTEALANPKVHWGNDGNAREFDGLVNDVDHPGAVSLNLTSNEGESHSTEGKTSTFGLGLPVVDPSFLELPGATIMEQGGRVMGGFFFVDEESCDDEAMNAWMHLALSFVEGLPIK